MHGKKKRRNQSSNAWADSPDRRSCSGCIPAKCCMYFSIEIDRPESAAEYDDILWILAHSNVEVYTVGKRWYVMVKNPCMFYDSSRGCTIYESRPRICRRHRQEECEANGTYDFDLHFKSYKELADFVKSRFERNCNSYPRESSQRKR